MKNLNKASKILYYVNSQKKKSDQITVWITPNKV